MPARARGARRAQEAFESCGGDQRGEDERQDVASRKREDERIDVRRCHGHLGEASAQAPRRIRDMEVDERTAVKVEKLRPEVAREPGVARENHQRPDAALTAPLPGDHAARHEDEADDGVRDDKGEIPRLIGDRLSHHGQRHDTN